MEFKGTKGKWEVLEYKNDLEIGNQLSTLVCSLPNKSEEYTANALLISKAPEMLEMLQKISSALEGLWHEDDSNSIFDLVDAEELDNLIKQATEL